MDDIIKAGNLEQLKKAIIIETTKNLSNIINTKNPRYKNITTQAPLGKSIGDNLYESTNKKNVVVRVTDRNTEGFSISTRPKWKIYTEYGNNDFLFLSPLKSWLEIHRKDGSFKRVINNVCESHRNGSVDIYIIEPSRRINEEAKNRKFREWRLGAFDFETYVDSNNIQVAYSCVIKTKVMGIKHKRSDNFFSSQKVEINKFYLSDYVDSITMVKYLIEEMCKYDKTYWYAHTMGRFDGLFILKALCEMNLKFKVFWNDDTLLTISITNPKLGTTIYIRDSLALIQGSLNSIAQSFNIDIEKGQFPHKFASLDNLNYIGREPGDEFYTNGHKSNNQAIYNFKEECLKYNTLDTELLYEIINTFSQSVWEEYKVDIVQTTTVSSLAMKIFLSSYYNSDFTPIHNTKGDIENCIREAYYGGISTVYQKVMNNCYFYDMVSQYPAAMLKDMPVGPPVGVANVKSIDNFFGFVYCNIIAPDENTLPNSILPRRSLDREEGRNIITLSRGTWDGWYFSEELKYAAEKGYIITPISGIKFKRGNNVFTSYIEEFFKLKKESTGSHRVFAKLMLNCLYGRWGMKERSESMRIMKAGTYDTPLTKYQYISEITPDWHLVKEIGNVNKELIKVLSKAKIITNDSIKLINEDNKPRYGTSTAVQISAAIAAYARISINEFKNIKGNPIAYTDTDSVVLQNPLPDEVVGLDIGMMKLEHKVDEGIFIRKKFYGIKTDKGRTIIKCSGANNQLLNWNDVVEASKGNIVSVPSFQMKTDWSNMTLKVVEGMTNLKRE